MNERREQMTFHFEYYVKRLLTTYLQLYVCGFIISREYLHKRRAEMEFQWDHWRKLIWSQSLWAFVCSNRIYAFGVFILKRFRISLLCLAHLWSVQLFSSSTHLHRISSCSTASVSASAPAPAHFNVNTWWKIRFFNFNSY